MWKALTALLLVAGLMYISGYVGALYGAWSVSGWGLDMVRASKYIDKLEDDVNHWKPRALYCEEILLEKYAFIGKAETRYWELKEELEECRNGLTVSGG